MFPGRRRNRARGAVRHSTMRRAAAAVLFALLAAGCANPGPGSAPAATSAAPTSAAPTEEPTGGPTVTVDGVVERGVEPGC